MPTHFCAPSPQGGVHQNPTPDPSDRFLGARVLAEKPLRIIALHCLPARGHAEPIHLRRLEPCVDHGVDYGDVQLPAHILQFRGRVATSVSDEPTCPACAERPRHPEVVFATAGLVVGSQEAGFLPSGSVLTEAAPSNPTNPHRTAYHRRRTPQASVPPSGPSLGGKPQRLASAGRA